MKQKAIIVDLDGTICENVTGRPWYGKRAAEKMIEDAPYINIINMIRAYCNICDLDLLILTGRHKGTELDVSLDWLNKYWLFPAKIFGRDLNDYTKTVVYKEKVYEELIKPNYDVVMVFEDNNACVQMFRDKGLTVLQPQNSEY